MTSTLLIVERPSDLNGCESKAGVCTASAYLAGTAGDTEPAVIVLGRGHRYGSLAYHCAAVAEARGRSVIPSVAAMADLRSQRTYRHALPELNRLLKGGACGARATPRHVDVFFGRCDDARFRALARRAFALFPFPILRIELRRHRDGAMRVAAIRPRALAQLRPDERPAFRAELRRIIERPPVRRPHLRRLAYDLAMLTDPNEVLRPSSERSLRKFILAGGELGVRVERIGKNDYARLTDFDALFIRETTHVNHHTYAFARRAAAAGLPVIDDPQSILRCTNKIFLADLLRAHSVPTPRSLIVDRASLDRVDEEIGYPAVLKIPDGSFSRGVYKVRDRRDLREAAGRLFRHSAALLAQEFVPTAFDWRIGLLNRRPIFACQYFMSRNHWQVNKVMTNGRVRPGRWSTCLVDDAPAEIVRVATTAANLVGDGLYGVDLKQTPGGVLVIEVNDNPSIECGSEDLCLGDELYRLVIRDFVRRIEARGAAAPTDDPLPHATQRGPAIVSA